MIKYFLVLFLLVPSRVSAQPTIFDPSGIKWDNTKAAQTLSNIGVGVGIGFDVYDVTRATDKKHASLVLAEKYAIILVVTEVTKRVIHRTRPDKSDNKSYPSEHTPFASGRWYIGLPVGYLRMAGDKHYLTDVMTGFGLRKLVDWKVK